MKQWKTSHQSLQIEKKIPGGDVNTSYTMHMYI